MSFLSSVRAALPVALLTLLTAGTVSAADTQKLSRSAVEYGEKGLRHYVLVTRSGGADESRQAALRNGLVLREHVSLRSNHLLVEGDVEQVKRAAEASGIAYVFPASDELVNGTPLYSCAGAMAHFQIGEYTERIGGWPAAAASYDIGVFFSSLPQSMDPEAARGQILGAMAVWTRVAAINFRAARRADEQRTINILFAARDHGDGSPFNGTGGLLAHTFYPAPPNPESLAGDMHFDADEQWGAGEEGKVDLFAVALHEVGHALGLGHSDQPGAVMYPYYTKMRALTSEDVAAIRQLYPARSTPLARGTEAPLPSSRVGGGR